MGSKKSRKNPRAHVSLVARYRSPTAFEFVSEECFDLSVGGMFIKSPTPAPAGTLLKLECDVDDGTAKIRGVARVVWLREQPTDGHPAGMGVKFVKLDAGGRDVINGILDRVGTELDEDGESRRSLEPGRATPEPFRRTPSSPPSAVVADADASATLQRQQAASRAGDHAASAKAPSSDAVTVRPPAGDALPQGAISQDARARAGAPDAQVASESAGTVPMAAPVGSTGSAAQSGEAAASEWRGRDPRLANGAAAVAKPVQRTPPSATGSASASRRSSGRPLAYAAVALLAAAGVFALAGREQRGAPEPEPEPVAANAPEPTPEPEATHAAAATAPPAPAEPAAQPSPAPDPQAAVPTSIAPVQPRYLLEVVTNPAGARVTAGEKTVVAPAEIDLGALADPLFLRAELDGYSPAGIRVDRVGFMLDEGAMRRRVVLRLNEDPKAQAESPRERAKSRRERAAKEESKRAPEPEVQTAEDKPEPSPAKVADTPVAAPAPAVEAKPAPAVEAKPAPALEIKPKPEAEPDADKATANSKQKPLEAAMECLSAGDNACVIKALEGKARSAQELELLIETYRTMGNAPKAEKYMQVYVDKHPGERRASAYRRVLENRQTDAPAP